MQLQWGRAVAVRRLLRGGQGSANGPFQRPSHFSTAGREAAPLPPPRNATISLTDGAFTPAYAPPRSTPRALLSDAVAWVLPAGYPDSVGATYLPYAAFSTAGVVVSAAGSVLATQCMLYSLGLGAGALPLAVGLNWVLKDGLGQLGGVAFAAFVNTRFDADPKRWRFLSAVTLDVASGLEIVTAFVPAAFLPVAAAANVLKNIAWLSSSATRASLHQSLARTGNLADVTAKAGAQTIGGATAGTALGVLLSAYLGAGAENLPAIASTFAGLSIVNLALVQQSLKGTVIPSLAPHRLWLACEGALQSSGEGQGAALPSARSPHDAAAREQFMPFQGDALQQAGIRITVGECSGAGGADLRLFAAASGAGASSSPSDSQYVLSLAVDGHIRLLVCRDASWRDVLLGYLHAMRLGCKDGRAVATPVSLEERVASVAASRAWIEAHGPALVQDLERAGWWVGQPLLEPDASKRVLLVQ